nr:zonadhesin-like protein 2 [Plectrocnemia conspersa]
MGLSFLFCFLTLSLATVYSHTTCAPACGENEVYSECGNNGCQNTCENPTLSWVCKGICTPGCICAEGYLKDKNGKCVLPCHCGCGENEVYSVCGNNGCQNTCENPTLSTICKGPCIPGCICAEGYLRDANGKCVLPKYCGCGQNEEYSECGNNGCQNTCENPTLSWACKGICNPGCICREGYLRNTDGKCVLPKDCDCKTCGLNEVYSECDNHPCQNTCEEPNRIASCSYAAGCYPGCICKEGFLRNNKGVCVPVCTCYTCQKNEIFSECSAHGCQNTCENPNLIQVCDPAPGCYPGCICKPGYLRNAFGECVKEKNCVKKCPGKHEVYSECGNNSCQKNCDTYDMNLACKPICTPGCICEDGYIRNQKGICVKPEDCDNRKCPGKNEAYTSCVCPCCETCATLGQDITCNFLVCNPGCDCKPGFFRNSKGVCVPPEECDCKKNEVLDLCYYSCPPQTCDAIGKMFKCAKLPCKPACKCKFNYRRNSNGICIPIKKCPSIKCTGINEVYDPCPPDCLDERCESLYDPLMCTAVVRECSPRCVCKTGYLRDKNGVCIPKESCPKQCPGKNQVYNLCPSNCPPEATCASYLSGIVVDCAQPIETVCIPRCECAPGYVRDTENGECVEPEQCSCSDPNAELVSCPNPCPGGTCESPEFFPCRRACMIRGCQCKKGYVKDVNGNCILLEQSKPCGDNEVYKCGSVCPATCDNRNPACTKQCVYGCFCKEGYILNNGVCILIEDCPSECPADEIYMECGTACPATCENYGKSIMCTFQCVSGCFCKTGLVRDCNGKCIKPENCPIKCTGPNEEYQECGTACPLTCENKNKNIICTEQCVKGCFCKKGYVRKNKICVKPEECGCGENGLLSTTKKI